MRTSGTMGAVLAATLLVAACGRNAAEPGAAAELPTLDVTSWTDRKSVV